MHARAPGDADILCTVTFPTSGEVQPAPLPANARVLMDSYDYISLLPRDAGGVWQQVDLDDNNEAGRSTEVANKYTLGHRSSWHVLNFSGARTPTFLADRQ